MPSKKKTKFLNYGLPVFLEVQPMVSGLNSSNHGLVRLKGREGALLYRGFWVLIKID